MKKNKKALYVRTNVQAGEATAVGYNSEECMNRCTVTAPEDLCSAVCNSKG
jgi:hypothetical protein